MHANEISVTVRKVLSQRLQTWLESAYLLNPTWDRVRNVWTFPRPRTLSIKLDGQPSAIRPGPVVLSRLELLNRCICSVLFENDITVDTCGAGYGDEPYGNDWSSLLDGKHGREPERIGGSRRSYDSITYASNR